MYLFTCKYLTSCGVNPNIHTESPVGLPATATQDDIGTINKITGNGNVYILIDLSTSNTYYFFPSGCISIVVAIPLRKKVQKRLLERAKWKCSLSLFSTCSIVRFVRFNAKRATTTRLSIEYDYLCYQESIFPSYYTFARWTFNFSFFWKSKKKYFFPRKTLILAL